MWGHTDVLPSLPSSTLPVSLSAAETGRRESSSQLSSEVKKILMALEEGGDVLIPGEKATAWKRNRDGVLERRR